MGKSKKPRIPNYHHVDRPKTQTSTGGGGGGPRKMSSFSRVSTSKGKKGGKGKGGNVGGGPGAGGGGKPPTIPFQRGDRVLLVGEGDFSFALSLATHHGCNNLLATSYDSEETLYQKYPQAKGHIEQLRSMGSAAAVPSPSIGLKRKRRESFDSDEDDEEEQEQKHDRAQNGQENPENPSADKSSSPPKSKPATTTTTSPKVLFSIDARKLGTPTGGAKTVRNGFPRPSTIPSSNYKRRDSHQKGTQQQPQPTQTQKHTPSGGPWDIICFNFPHVGGLSTDVNRQVRANQELLVEFFKASVPLLSNPIHTNEDEDEDEDEDEEDYDENEFYPSDSDSNTNTDPRNPKKEKEKQKPRTTPGQILISLFEGEPYTLWNIRDLARHAGLRVVTSFRFPWGSYPGYAHARTLGEIEGRDGGRGGWRGEEREARMFVFEKKDVEGGVGEGTGKKRKRRAEKGRGKGKGKGKGKDEGWGGSDSD